MAEFDELRNNLRKVRAGRDTASERLAALQERLKRLASQKAELDRIFNPNVPQHLEERQRLQEQSARAEAEFKEAQRERAAAASAEATLVNNFAIFTDPRDGISRMNDRTPILLMPVRLETRFKDMNASASGIPERQLWVRVYPDDCWLDSFNPTLTDSEVVNGKTYWSAIWAAGGVEDQERGAWRGLAGAHGSGRARWIVEQFQPVNMAEKPAKAQPQDIILTIPADTALASAEKSATLTFWRDLWLSDGDSTKADLARQALQTAVGAARAAEITNQYVPVNFANPIATGFTRDQVSVSAAYVVLPAVVTRQNAWSTAPKVTILPDRFLFIGYRNDEAPVVVISNPVPSPLMAGPDPSAPEADQLKHDADGNLVVPDELKWMSDFDRAVQVGMGFRIPLTPAQADGGFDRVLVVGLRLNADEQAGKTELETLLRHHSFSRTGLAVVPQGTPTNNTEGAGSGFGRLDDPDQSFNDAKAPLFTASSNWLDKKDGQWLAEYLGIDAALFANAHNAGATDQIAGRAMNTALWPTTMGYWMEGMMAPVFTRPAVEQTRAFFNRYVIASGAVPALRIGSQPYGILPATTLSRMNWLNSRRAGPGIEVSEPSTIAYLRSLYPILRSMYQDWSAKVPELSYAGKAGDPHAMLLDIVGLHPGSVEWSQRYAESLQTLFNRLNLQGFGGMIESIILAVERQLSRTLLTNNGYPADGATPLILEKIFSGAHSLLKGGVVDDQPLSETLPIRPYTAPAALNYIEWLINAANTSLDAVYTQDGFKDDKPPTALLYLLLRHAIQLGYHDVSIRLHENAGIYNAERAALARTDDPFLHVRDNNFVSESRYAPLYAVESGITGSATQTVSQFISAQLNVTEFAFYLREQLDALNRLKGEPTARLERAFADHVDCCSYRLDAWLLGIINYQLAAMRGIREDQDNNSPQQGIYLGAYAWLEEVRPANKVLTPVSLRDPDLVRDFETPNEPPLMRDSTNQGYIHAPSLNHAVAAAVLRNGFISNASPENRGTMAVNLTSERVRTALALLEGIRGGQGLADLLGYQFERGLHDRHSLAEVDKFIYKLRKAFPLRADRMNSTRSKPGDPIEAIEARNVLDGLAFVDQLNKAPANRAYPFGVAGLPSATPAEAAVLNSEADRLLESHDGVADLALSEGVYQAVLGNYDRVASTYDAYARGHFPPEPDVVRTPLKGIGITHRVGLHLEAGADPTISPVPGLDMTPRAQGEPALNRWLAAILPPPDQVACVVAFRDANTGAALTREITLRDIALQPADLVAIIRDDTHQPMSELDDRMVRFAVTNFAPRPDVPVAVRYMDKQAARFSVFELMPLLRYVRRVITKSRPLKTTDLILMNEAEGSQDTAPMFDKQRLVLVRNAGQTLRGDFAAFRAQLQGPLSDLTNRRAEILADVDTWIADLVELLARAATFGMAQAGWGFAYEFRNRTVTAILKQAADLVVRWTARLVDFDAKIAAHDALPGTATDAQRFAVLIQAERIISTVATNPLPATPALYRADLVGVQRPSFEARRDQFAGIRNTTRTQVSLLLSDIAALLPVSAFDATEYTLTAHEDEMVRFAEDALSVAGVMIANLDRRLQLSQDQFDAHDAAAAATDRVGALGTAAKALLGEDFRIYPEFALNPAQGEELANALTASRSGDLFEYLTTPPDPAIDPLDFPVDTWLYGVARVRETMHDWEQLVMMTGSLGRAEPNLDVIQLPFIPGDRWVALEFPPDTKLDTDRLLYTAHFATAFNKAANQCGMLMDEWTELIPGATTDTGITLHYDRPNCEAPQSMLLMTPSEFRGAWQWNDLVDTLNETLDFAKRRAVEPKHIDDSLYAPFLPATVMATQAVQLTIAANLALNNNISLVKS